MEILNNASSRILDHLLNDTNVCLQRDMTMFRASLDSISSRKNPDITSSLHREFGPTLNVIRQRHHKKISRLLTHQQQPKTLFHTFSHQYTTNQRQSPLIKRIRASRKRHRKRRATTKSTISTPQTHVVDDLNTVICTPPTVNLTSSEKSILSKGLKFIPLEKQYNHRKAMDDAHRFMRSLRLKFYFENNKKKHQYEPKYLLKI